MNSINDISLDCNKIIRINFEGGDLSSDAGLLLIKEFAEKMGFTDLVKSNFKPTILLHFVSTQMWIIFHETLLHFLQPGRECRLLDADDLGDAASEAPVIGKIAAGVTGTTQTEDCKIGGFAVQYKVTCYKFSLVYDLLLSSKDKYIKGT